MSAPAAAPPASRALALLLFGAFSISFSPVLVKLLGQGIVGPTAIGFWRTLLGAAFLFAFALLQRRPLRLSRAAFGWTLFAGFFFCFDLWFWHRAILYVGAGMSTVLGNTQVFSTALLSVLFFGDRLSARFFVAAASALAGVALLAGLGSAEVELTPVYLRGIVYGLLTGVAYAFYIVGIKRAGVHASRPDLVAMMAWTSLFAAIFLAPLAAVEPHPVWPPDARAWAILLALGLVVQAVAWWAIARALTRLATPRASLVLLLQPTLAVAWGWWLFAETLTAIQLLGAAITLGAIYLGSVRR